MRKNNLMISLNKKSGKPFQSNVEFGSRLKKKRFKKKNDEKSRLMGDGRF